MGFRAALTVALPSAAAPAAANDAVGKVRSFLRAYVDRHGGSDPSTGYAVAFSDLNGDGKPEAVVSLSGPGRCGSGGCKALDLTPHGHSYRAVMIATVTRLPIKVLPGMHHGWHDIGVGIGGGGPGGGEVALAFDGHRYPGDPTVLRTERRNPCLAAS